MSKKKNDMFEYEKQWQLYKGNEYMFRLLSKMSPKVECKCPKSYLYYQKMSKNHMQDITKKHELMLQNKIMKNKLKNSKSTVRSKIDRLTQLSLMQSTHSRSQRSLNKALEENQILWENSNMFKRISNSKSFFSTVKCYSTVCQDNNNEHNNNLKTKLKKIRLPHGNVNNNQNSSYNSYMIQSSRSIDINKDLSCNSNNQSHHSLFHEISNRNFFFNYIELKEESTKTNNYNVILYKKNRFIAKIGLVTIKILFQLNKVVIVIEPISSSIPNIYSVIISDEYNLSQLHLMFRSYDDLVLALKFHKNDFVFRSKYRELKYYTQIKGKETSSI